MLREWVNTDVRGMLEDANAWERLLRRFPEIPSIPVAEIMPAVGRFLLASRVAEYLRKAWDTANPRDFEWYLWKAQIEYEREAICAKHNEDKRSAILEAEDPSPVITAVEAAIFYLRHNRNRALHCPNPECPAPYFFSSKKGQKYCSPECAKPSQRQSKRQWWIANRAKERDV